MAAHNPMALIFIMNEPRDILALTMNEFGPPPFRVEFINSVLLTVMSAVNSI